MESEFNLKMLFSVLKKSIIWIILIAVVAAGAIFVLGSMSRPVYYSYSDFYVINTAEEEDFTQSALVSAAKAIANDYIEIIKSDKMLLRVCDELKTKDIECTVDQIRAMISCSVKAEAALFTVNVSSEDPELAKSVLQTIEANAPAVIDDTVKRNNCVEVITFAKDARRVASNNTRNALFAFAIAAVMAYVLFLIIALLDTTVNTEDDLKNKFDLPILGVIPEWTGGGN